jgi:ATP-dependent helicase/nuclease subunit A
MNTSLKNNQNGLNIFFEKCESFYKKAKIIKTPFLRNNHLTPVSLRKDEDDTIKTLGRGFIINNQFSGEASCDIFNKVDTMLSRFSNKTDENNEKFNSGSFGTIAHICVEAQLNKEEAVIPSNISGLLTPYELSALLKAGNEIASRFISSPLGIIAQNAKLRESEFTFRSLIKNHEGREVFINGTIDLFFEDANSIHVVDFKTDSRETPSEHVAQMACYYQAVSSLFALPAKKECCVWLYYLRTGHAVEVTEKVKQFNLTQRAFY